MPPDPKSDLTALMEDLRTRIASYQSRPGRVNESNTIRALITPVIAALGWAIDDLDEVQSEYRHASSDNPVDYALFHDGAPALFIEAKALEERLDDRKWIVQTLNYANACNVEWAVLTNGAEWRVYNVHAKSEAEDKLFYAAHIDGRDVRETVRRLSMLSKGNMAPKRALDQLWREASVDREMRRVIERLPDNRSAIRAIARDSEHLTEADVREALRRLGLRADWRDEDDLFPGCPTPAPSSTPTAPAPEPQTRDTEKAETPAPGPAATKPKKHARMADLFQAGLIAPGDTLRLRPRLDEVATVVDGKTCEYRGERMSYNEWGCKATGWTAIQIYIHAETEDGRLLQDLREELAAQS